MSALLRPLRSLRARRALALLLRRVGPLRPSLRLATRLVVRGQRIGALGLVQDARGRVLLAEHLFRPSYPWGLPGGWLHRGEDPRVALARELREETGLEVEVGRLLLCVPHGPDSGSETAAGLSLVYECSTTQADAEIVLSWELLDAQWLEPAEALLRVRRFEQDALRQVIEARASTIERVASAPAARSGA